MPPKSPEAVPGRQALAMLPNTAVRASIRRMDEVIHEGGCLCGQVRWRASGPPANVRLCHCRLCQRWTGAPMFAQPRDPPQRLAVSLATADERNAFRPDCHIWVGEKLDWVNVDDGLPTFPEGLVSP